MKQISLPKWACWICLLLVSSVLSQTISAEAAEECQSYRGIKVCPLGSATIEVDDNDERLYINNLASRDSDGIMFDASAGNQWAITLEGVDPREMEGSGIVLQSANHAMSEQTGGLGMEPEGSGWTFYNEYPTIFDPDGVTVAVHNGEDVTTFEQQAIDALFLEGIWSGANRIVVSTPSYYYEEWHIAVIPYRSGESATVSIEGETLPIDMLMVRTAPISAEEAAERPAATMINLMGREADGIEITALDVTNKDLDTLAVNASNKSLNTTTPDLGDAPDSTNHYLNSMSAYTGIMAHYPTVFDATTGTPVGPLHHNPETWYSLGPDISWEQEADNGFDSDWGVHNIDPFTDTPDRDRFDDGLLLPGHFVACEPTQMTFTVDVLPAATATDAYVNVWIDWDKSGAWGEVRKCLQGPSAEWAVQNQVISWSGPGYHTFTTDVFMPPSQGAPDESWIRISLSDDVAPSADGRGPAAGWDYGETEDYLWEAAAGEICGLKFHDENGNSVNDSEPGISGWPIYIVDSSGMTTTVTTDDDGNYCVSLPPGDYTVYEDPAGMVQTFPSTVDYDVIVALGQTINNIDFGNKKPCDHPFEDYCTAGTHDLFMGPEPTYINTNDVAGGWLTSCSNGILNQFDVAAQNQCFAHSFDIANGDECLSYDCIIGGTMTIRLRAGQSSLASNDTIHFLEDGTNVWSSLISDLPGGSGWGANTTGTFTFDLTNMPNDGANILSMAMDGDLTIRIQDDTGVDWIDLTILYCDDSPPEAEGDLGDAPTSYNHFDLKMSAYPGDPLGSARYPTVFDAPSGTPIGPYHHYPREQAWLGKWVSLEDEADVNPSLDEDGLTNIDPPNDLNNRDHFDDSVNPASIQLPQCDETQFKYTVSSDTAATLTSWHTNVWFDFNQDGDWDDQFKCETSTGSTLLVYEWAVQDQVITVSPGSVQVGYATPLFVAAVDSADKATWMRITLTESPINGHPGTSPPIGGNPDGRGPATGWRYGETEDYLLRPQGECDLTIGKKHSPSQFEYGGVGTYHIGVTNSGNASCQGPIVVKDTLPEGMTFDAGSVAGTGWSCTSDAPADPETVICTHAGPLPASTSLDTLTFNVNIPSVGDAGGQGWNGDSVTNCATVDGPNDADSSNNTACDTAIIILPLLSCDLTIGKKHSPIQFEYDGVGTYHIGVANTGTDPCAGPIVVTDTLPEGMVFDASSVTGTGWSCTSDAPANPETVICTHAGPLPASTSLDTLTFDVNVPSVGDAGGQGWNGNVAVNCATVDGPNDVNPDNNKDCDKVEVIPLLLCDLSVEKWHDPDAFVYGGVGSYTIAVSNLGDGLCKGPITISDTLPAGMVFDSSSVIGTGWTCTSDAPANPETVTCTHAGPIPIATSLVPVTFNVSVPSIANANGAGWDGNIVTNCVSVSGPTDSDLSNNHACDEVRVITKRQCDLTVQKQHMPNPFEYGGIGSYAIAVTNNGNIECQGPIAIVDTLPTGMVFDDTSVSGTGWGCTSDAPSNPETVTCIHAGSIPPMTSMTPVIFDVSVPTPANASGEGWDGNVAINCAEVNGPNDSDLTNNHACDEAVCTECEPGTETYHGGVADNFASGNVELTHRSPALDDYITYHTDGEYDESSANRFFGESFIVPDSETRHICGATLIIRLDQLGELQGNDTISLNFIEYDSSGTAVQAVPGGGWSYNVGNLLTLLAGGASPATLTLDLSALPLTGGGTKDLLGSFSTLRYLDVMVQDDTAVDFVDLVVDYCCDEETQSDFGDAPDSNNSGGHSMIAYPTLGVQGMFPSVYVGATTVPGPRHENPRDGAWLGAQVTLEQDADQLPDEDDPFTNIDPANDLANRDRADDALQQKLIMPYCNEMKFDYSATNVSSMNNWYVNVWIDFNQDGDWDDTIKCWSPRENVTRVVHEWAVQDQMVVLPTSTSSLLTTPTFNATNVKVDGMWMRMMLSESPSADSDGRGPVGGYRFGETEDYLLPPSRGSIHGHKWHDLNRNGVWDGNEPVIANWPIVLTSPDGRIVRTTTDANGEYTFVDLPDGEYTVREGLRSRWIQTFPANGEGHTVTVEDAATIEDRDFGNSMFWKIYCVTPKQVNYGEGSTRTGIEVMVYNKSDQAHTYTVAVFDAEGTNLTVNERLNSLTVEAGSRVSLPIELNFAAAKAGTYQVIVSSDANTKFGCDGNLSIREDGLLLESQDEVVILGNTQKPTIRFPFRNSNDVPITVGYRIRADLFAFAGEGRASQSSISLDGQAAGTDVVGQITIEPNSTAEIPVSVSWSGSSTDFNADITVEADTNGDGEADTSATAYVQPDVVTSIQLRHVGQQMASNVAVLLFIMLSMVTIIPMRGRYRS